MRRTLTYIGDLCNIFIDVAFSEKCANDVFNVGGEDYSLKEMAELIAGKYGVGIEYVPWPEIALKIESGDTVFNSDRLDSLIGKNNKIRIKDWILNVN
jgi:UDP-glucose 4-epimerase